MEKKYQEYYETVDKLRFGSEKEALKHEKELEQRGQKLKDLEVEFLKVLEEIYPQIKAKIEEANKIYDLYEEKVDEIRQLSDESGIPFGIRTKFTVSGYKPTSINKWNGLDIFDYLSYNDIPNLYEVGWNHSDIC